MFGTNGHNAILRSRSGWRDSMFGECVPISSITDDRLGTPNTLPAWIEHTLPWLETPGGCAFLPPGHKKMQVPRRL